MQTKLRPWQAEALQKALQWLVVDRKDRHYLINAAPGAGKTIAACAIAKALIDANEIDRVVVIAPRAEVVNQWADDFRRTTGRFMSKVTGGDTDVESLQIDVCATWASVQGLLDAFQAICRSHRTLVICDEHHHAAVEAAWGKGTNSAFADAAFALILTGTPIRTDGAQSVWLAYDDVGAIDHPEDGTYTLTYGEAVDLGYCRPVTFHRHEGKFTIDLEGGSAIQVSGHAPAQLTPELKRIPGLQRALNFLPACLQSPVPVGRSDPQTGWVPSDNDRMRGREANRPAAANAERRWSGDRADNPHGRIYRGPDRTYRRRAGPFLVHCQLPIADANINAFRNLDWRWIVSVALISEGFDIKRLRVLVYLPNALTELAFRQAIGRVVRNCRAAGRHACLCKVMPSFETFRVLCSSHRGGNASERRRKGQIDDSSFEALPRMSLRKRAYRDDLHQLWPSVSGGRTNQVQVLPGMQRPKSDFRRLVP